MFWERKRKSVEKKIEYWRKYLSEQFDRKENYQKIIKKVEGDGNMTMKKYLSIVAVVIVIIFVGAMTPNIYASIKWDAEYKEYQNRKVDYGLGAINTAVNEYETNIDMNYVYQDNIGVKLNSLMITDDYFKMDIDFKIPEEIQVNTDTFCYNFAVYDEKNNIYGIFERLKVGEEQEMLYWKKLYQELGVKYDKNNVYDIQYQNSCQGAAVLTSEKGYMITSSSMTSSKGFPKSKKIYIRIFDVGYSLYDYDKEARKMLAVNNVTISNAEWILEIDVPESFYNRETMMLKVAEEIEGFELTKADVTETGMVVKVKLDGMLDIISAGREQSVEEFDNAVHQAIHMEDEEGNVYYNFGLATTGFENEVEMKFDVDKEKFQKSTYYLCITVRGKSYRLKMQIK